jgi:acid phosphatase
MPIFLLFCASLLTLTAQAESLPHPDHVVVVIEENRSYSHIMDPSKSASYIRQLIHRGMLFTQSYAVSHPSQPNYLALFSGSTQGQTNDNCPLQFNGDNLASALANKGLSFASYSESLPFAGDLRCWSAGYQRKHNPVANWQGSKLPPGVNLRFEDFPEDYSHLPTVSFVIPDQHNDMHDGSFATADDWLKTHIDPYITWAFQHNSLLILTWDEDDGSENNRIVTLFIGPMVKTGSTDQHINHYNVLRTLLDLYGLPAINATQNVNPVLRIWNTYQ